MEESCTHSCLHLGHCVEYLGRFMCNCRTGYTGDSCQLRSYDEYMMFLTSEDYEKMYNEVLTTNEIYKYVMLGVGFFCIVGIVASVAVAKRYQTKQVRMNRSHNQLVSDMSSSGLAGRTSGGSEQLIVTTEK